LDIDECLTTPSWHVVSFETTHAFAGTGKSLLFVSHQIMKTDQLKKFEESLLSLIGKPTHLRPFVCDGSPLECSVFIIGFNPATTMTEDFWSFWQSDYGFNKTLWFKAYKNDRLTQPLKPGKKRRNSISNTRRILEWILEEALPIKCLETNIYAAPSKQAIDLSINNKVTAPFNFLLETIKPKIIIAHGQDATDYIKSINLPVQTIFVKHLSRGWSQESARKLGCQIKSLCLG